MMIGPIDSLPTNKGSCRVSYEGGSTTLEGTGKARTCLVGCDGRLQDLCLEVITVHGNEFSLLDYEIVPLSLLLSFMAEARDVI